MPKDKSKRKIKPVITWLNPAPAQEQNSPEAEPAPVIETPNQDNVLRTALDLIEFDPEVAEELKDPTGSFEKPELEGKTSEEVVELFEEFIGYKLEPEQVGVLKYAYENPAHNIVFTAPTGFGKSVVIYFLAWLGVSMVFAGPLKALASEKFDDIGAITQFIVRATGDDFKRRQTVEFKDALKESRVRVTTYEAADSNLRKSDKDLFNDVSTVVIDEIHMMGNKSRGHVVEGLIIKLQRLLPDIRIIGLSATLPNCQQVADWLGAELFSVPNERRPVPLYVRYNPDIMKADTASETRQKQGQLFPLIEKHKDRTGLVFCSSRMRSETLCYDYNRASHSMSPILMAKKFGVSYHHAGLTPKERRTIEDMFRAGEVKLLFTTTTFAMGVNLPADVIYFFDLSRWTPESSQKEFYEPDEIVQIIGRGGRRASPSGEGIAYFFGHWEETALARDTIANPPNINSHIQEFLPDKVLEWCDTEIANHVSDIVETAKSSLAYHQGFIRDKAIYEAVEMLRKAVLLYVRDDVYRVTVTGRLTSKWYMRPETVIKAGFNISDMIKAGKELEHKSMFDATLATKEVLENIVVRDMDRGIIEDTIDYMGYGFSSEIAKVIGYIFSKQISQMYGTKFYISRGDKWRIKNQISRMIDALGVILPTSIFLKEHKAEVKLILSELSLLIEFERFEPEKIQELKSLKKELAQKRSKRNARKKQPKT